MKDIIPIKRALISVSDKAGIVDFAEKLIQKNIEILSTGGTSKLLVGNKIAITSVDSYTGFPEIMDGRVKTLHPKIHGGILAVRENMAHVSQMERNEINPIDLVVVNLYPFKETIAKPNVSLAEAIENIDIGGPAMLRSAAKNHAYVTVIVDPADYATVLAAIETQGGIDLKTRRLLALKAFRHTADYDSAIDVYLSQAFCGEDTLRLVYQEGIELRYGENPHQSAVFYRKKDFTEPSISSAEQLHGKELSYNNIVDGDAALEAVKEIADAPAVAIIKHTNPCGFATGVTLDRALASAWSGDPVSSYGSVIAVSRIVDLATAKFLGGKFVEMLIAPDFNEEALLYLREKSSAIRLLKVGTLETVVQEQYSVKHVVGGLLKQDRDLKDFEKWETVTTAPFPDGKVACARFSWKACKHVKSNAIVLAQEYEPGAFKLVGMGAGQPNRVDSLKKLAIPRARENFIIERESIVKDENKDAARNGRAADTFRNLFQELVLGSDAFFPFPDNVEEAHAAGVRYIVQPGGSKRDSEVVDACNRYGISMIFTGTRHFRH
ncbi:MAG TPA: bifunctional phosphoribosylaminoimidazolecarboxamide formyltransferase/IMP cyclohydrolase [Chitinivibrionales bacterium]